MKRFASLFPFVERDGRPMMGRLVANHDFAKTLVRFGAFDELVFSGPSLTNLRAFAALAAGWQQGRGAAVRCVPWTELQPLMADGPLHVVHLGGWGHFMPGLHYLRARHAGHPFPVTAVIHSLNGREAIDHAVRLTHAGLEPFDAVFCTSRDGLEAFRRLLDGASAISGRAFRGRLVHLPLGLDDDLVDALLPIAAGRRGGRAPESAALRNELRIPESAVVLLALGRMTPSRKMDLGPLLRVFGQDVAPAAEVPVVLVVAGQADQAELRLVKDDVARLGLGETVRLYANFPVERKAAILGAADVLVAPTDNTQETFGLSLLEAFAAGLPVVASRFDGYKDLVDDGVDGFLVDTVAAPDVLEEWGDVMDPNVAQLYQSQGTAVDVDRLAERVLALVRDPAARLSLGRAGHRKVGIRYRYSRVLAEYEAVWDELAEAAARSALDRERPRNPWALGPGHVFPHYPSATLDDEMLVVVRRRGDGPSPYADVSPVLSAALLAEIVSRAGEPVAVGRLCASCGAPPGHVRLAVVWLLKYGVLGFGVRS